MSHLNRKDVQSVETRTGFYELFKKKPAGFCLKLPVEIYFGLSLGKSQR